MQLGLVPARCWGLPDAVLLRAGAEIRMGTSRIDAGAHQPSIRCGISASLTRNCKTAQLTRRHALPCPETSLKGKSKQSSKELERCSVPPSQPSHCHLHLQEHRRSGCHTR